MEVKINSGADLAKEVNSLASSWTVRTAAIKKWYNMIRLVDDLKQDKMESVISSDPRTSFNMASWLLTPKTPVFAVDTEGMNEAEISSVGAIEAYCNREYLKEQRRTASSLYGRFDKRLVNYMLATGWYSIISHPTPDGWIWGVWNPTSVYPEYDQDGGLVKVARRYRIPARHAAAKISAEGWQAPNRKWTSGQLNVYTEWWMDWDAELQENVAWFCAGIGTELVRPPTSTPFRAIPVHVAPVAGLPDDGSITQDDSWRAEIGNSLVVPILDIQKNYNRMLSYMQQLIRDTANPRWVEKVRGSSVLDPDKLFERGAVFTIEPGEEIFHLATPPLPAEMRTHEFDLRNQIQRGSFSDLTFGNVTQQVSAMLVTQVTASAQQILNPFQLGVMAAFSRIAAFNIAHMRAWGMELSGASFPKLPDLLTIDFKYDVAIPGDFVNRANISRILNPEFRLSAATLMELLIPEVRNAVIEKGNLQAEDALNNPIARAVLSIWQLQLAAREARNNNDEQLASMLERAAALMEGQTFGAQKPAATTPGVPGAPDIQALLGGSL
mgnify:CR=1 FL=1